MFVCAYSSTTSTGTSKKGVREPAHQKSLHASVHKFMRLAATKEILVVRS